jgi:hypothetical protein
MAQTTGQTSFRANKVEVSVNGSSWTDISGFSNSVIPDGGNRKIGEDYTFDGDTALLTPGKREPMDLKVRIIYTEGAADPQEVVRAAYEAASPLYIRWSPKGGNSGNFRYTASSGIVATPPYPGGEASSEKPVITEFTVKSATVTKDVV